MFCPDSYKENRVFFRKYILFIMLWREIGCSLKHPITIIRKSLLLEITSYATKVYLDWWTNAAGCCGTVTIASNEISSADSNTEAAISLILNTANDDSGFEQSVDDFEMMVASVAVSASGASWVLRDRSGKRSNLMFFWFWLVDDFEVMVASLAVFTSGASKAVTDRSGKVITFSWSRLAHRLRQFQYFRC